ncbi:uncharacterized protein LOC127874432 isoform X4 [Dreissena polymorpha]|uniref:uncharacterized protein LOC127874432 isoform X4 n=1 Tax=Dreissena polymorpha TaxID=45954 RepID=UPI0022651F6B|nr:uncharacterized protein LOC127874432 isoform X4 [Dreissena polymorpha]
MAILLVMFNQDVQDVVNWNMLTLSPASLNRSDKVFVLTNENNTDFTNFQWSFHVLWKGVITNPEPTGTCQLFKGNADFTTQAPVSFTQTPESRSVSTSGYVGIGIGVFVIVLVAAAVVVFVYKRRRRQLHTEDPYSRYSPKADKCDVPTDIDNVPKPLPHRSEQKPRHSYLELDGAVYDEIEDVASSISQPDNGYLTLVTASHLTDIPAPLKTKDEQLLPVRVTSYETPTSLISLGETHMH